MRRLSIACRTENLKPRRQDQHRSQTGYGVANLETLSACDENYTTLCRTIYEYAECLKKLGHDAEAVRVLEYGISCGSDHSGNYRMLADYYLNARDSAALDRLLASARALESPDRVPS